MEEGRPMKRMKIGKLASASFSTLPVEVFFIVFKHLDVVSRIRLRRVNRKWNSILCDSAVWENIKLTEQELLHLRNQAPQAKTSGRITRRFFSLPKNLSKAGVFKHVKHLMLEGDYDLSDHKPHDNEWPFPLTEIIPKTMECILDSQTKKSSDFLNLERVVVRRAALNLADLDVLIMKNIKCQLTIEIGSVVMEDNDSGDPWYLEIPIPESRIFNLSGRAAWLDRYYQQFVRASEEENKWNKKIPLELAEFVAERCNAVPPEAVAQLGDAYAELLKGREGLVIRGEVQTLFDEVVVNIAQNNGYDLDRKHYEQCKDYDFSSLGNWYKHTLVYYSMPRNCYKLAGAEEPPLSHG